MLLERVHTGQQIHKDRVVRHVRILFRVTYWRIHLMTWSNIRSNASFTEKTDMLVHLFDSGGPSAQSTLSTF